MASWHLEKKQCCRHVSDSAGLGRALVSRRPVAPPIIFGAQNKTMPLPRGCGAPPPPPTNAWPLSSKFTPSFIPTSNCQYPVPSREVPWANPTTQ